MDNNRMIVTGEKESFIVRVLGKKAKDAGAECEFVKIGRASCRERVLTTV